MKLDFVHDVQITYRKLLDSMSRPGVISQLGVQADKINAEAPCYNSTLLIAIALLDTEVTFKVISAEEEQISRLLNQLTYARETTVDHADYIFILSDATSEQVEQSINAAKMGDLRNPHESATVIIEVRSVSKEPELLLVGPGIEESCWISVQPIDSWLQIRIDKNREFPLGIDFIIVDQEHRAIALPRTTQIKKQVNES
ncbi:MAG: phosphonate C-P lyase system protein PhnH [Gorillibacterium sp.]|nr:phosphonate C-P lyase system protein PhnH [Gorillibacterium sp.]